MSSDEARTCLLCRRSDDLDDVIHRNHPISQIVSDQWLQHPCGCRGGSGYAHAVCLADHINYIIGRYPPLVQRIVCCPVCICPFVIQHPPVPRLLATVSHVIGGRQPNMVYTFVSMAFKTGSLVHLIINESRFLMLQILGLETGLKFFAESSLVMTLVIIPCFYQALIMANAIPFEDTLLDVARLIMGEAVIPGDLQSDVDPEEVDPEPELGLENIPMLNYAKRIIYFGFKDDDEMLLIIPMLLNVIACGSRAGIGNGTSQNGSHHIIVGVGCISMVVIQTLFRAYCKQKRLKLNADFTFQEYDKSDSKDDLVNGFENTTKTCWICYGTSAEDIQAQPWVSPCKCSGSTRYVHESCLRYWMLNKPDASIEGTLCPQCNTELIVEHPPSPFSLTVLETFGKYFKLIFRPAIVVIRIAEYYFLVKWHGTVFLMQIFGFRGAVQLLASASPMFRYVIVPCLPLALIAEEVIPWESPIVNLITRKKNIVIKSRFSLTLSSRQCFVTFMSPTFGLLIGDILYSKLISSDWRRFMAGYFTFIVGKRLVDVYYRWSIESRKIFGVGGAVQLLASASLMFRYVMVLCFPLALIAEEVIPWESPIVNLITRKKNIVIKSRFSLTLSSRQCFVTFMSPTFGLLIGDILYSKLISSDWRRFMAGYFTFIVGKRLVDVYYRWSIESRKSSWVLPVLPMRFDDVTVHI